MQLQVRWHIKILIFFSECYSHSSFEDLNYDCYKELSIPPMRAKEVIATFLFDRGVTPNKLNH